MDFQLTREQQTFRQEVRNFLEGALPRGWRNPMWPGAYGEGFGEDDKVVAVHRDFHRRLVAKGWFGLTYPREYGGQERSPIEQLIFNDELSYRGAPPLGEGATFVAPAILHHGTEAQKKEFLPRILRAELFFCEGFSEPDSGSDLGSLMTRAVEDGDDFVVNGQKIWTGMAQHADFCWLAARTDQQAPKHKGISLFLVSMRTPGITVRPIINMLGVHQFNEVFFDNVRVSRKYLMGEKNQGWHLITTTLDFERPGLVFSSGMTRVVEELIDYAKNTKENGTPLARKPLVRQKLAQLTIEVEVARVLAYRLAWLQTIGRMASHDSAILKLFATELSQRLASAGMQILGLHGILDQECHLAPLAGRIARGYLNSLSATIGAGTSEVQRNLIAIRGLGMPR